MTLVDSVTLVLVPRILLDFDATYVFVALYSWYLGLSNQAYMLTFLPGLL